MFHLTEKSQFKSEFEFGFIVLCHYFGRYRKGANIQQEPVFGTDE